MPNIPSNKESVEWVSMMGLDRGGFVLMKEKRTFDINKQLHIIIKPKTLHANQYTHSILCSKSSTNHV